MRAAVDAGRRLDAIARHAAAAVGAWRCDAVGSAFEAVEGQARAVGRDEPKGASIGVAADIADRQGRTPSSPASADRAASGLAGSADEAGHPG
jgi:hypothetical protein